MRLKKKIKPVKKAFRILRNYKVRTLLIVSKVSAVIYLLIQNQFQHPDVPVVALMVVLTVGVFFLLFRDGPGSV